MHAINFADVPSTQYPPLLHHLRTFPIPFHLVQSHPTSIPEPAIPSSTTAHTYTRTRTRPWHGPDPRRSRLDANPSTSISTSPHNLSARSRSSVSVERKLPETGSSSSCLACNGASSWMGGEAALEWVKCARRQCGDGRARARPRERDLCQRVAVCFFKSRIIDAIFFSLDGLAQEAGDSASVS